MQTNEATTTTLATFAKLSSGDWGIRTRGFIPAFGELVNVTKRDGSTSPAVVTRVVWSGADRETGEPTALCAIVATRPQRAAKPNASTSSAQRTKRASGFRGARKPQPQPAPTSYIDTVGETVETDAPAFVW